MKIRCSSLVGFVSLIGLLAVPPLFGQNGFNFNTFSSIADLTLNGSAAQAGNVLRLTSSTNTSPQTGSTWFSTQQ